MSNFFSSSFDIGLSTAPLPREVAAEAADVGFVTSAAAPPAATGVVSALGTTPADEDDAPDSADVMADDCWGDLLFRRFESMGEVDEVEAVAPETEGPPICWT